MGYGVLFTIVDDYRDDYGMSETEIGYIIGLGFISAFFAQLVLGPIADRGRARQMVFLGVGINVVGMLLMGFGESSLPIIAGRLISGVGIGAAVPAVKRIVVLADPDNLGENLGRLLAADVFGFAAGPAVSAALVGPFGLSAPFIVVTLLTVIAVTASLGVKVSETVDYSGQRLALDLLKLRPVAGGVALGAAAFMMIGAFDALWALVHSDLGTSDRVANLGITLFAIPLIVLGPTGGRWAQRVGPYRIAAAGMVVAAGFMASYGLLPSGSWIFGVAMFHAISDGLTISAAGVAVSMSVPVERQAAAQGVLGAAQALAGGITAIVIGSIYDDWGRAPAYIAAAIGMLILTAIGMTLAYDTWRHQRFRTALPTEATRAASGTGI